MFGKAEALRAIHKIKSNGEAARLLIRVCCAIGMADGDFDAGEKAAVKEICLELDLNPSEFGLEDSVKTSDSDTVTPNANHQQTVKRQEIERFKNKEFLETVVAGCALVAAADGKIDAREKETMERFLKTNEAVKTFDSQ